MIYNDTVMLLQYNIIASWSGVEWLLCVYLATMMID